eukprot:CAMPEP_0185770660 /NCGR_PEP_ID=MMETSP1174-20130828/60389_1 /TAXON_ID=35687 /ORGANISM="Dictyocha speculum, Strain CCMP1381" /LENGTH=221 /DNA_ID=CAMNT_0028456193 /DNA_START=167 /DNA_END=832 /DNA_ORIENTATION=+
MDGSSSLGLDASHDARKTDLPAALEPINRRDISATILSALAIGASFPAISRADDTLQNYKDLTYGATFDVPSGWQKTETNLSGDRKLVVYVDPKDDNTNAFVLFTPIAADYTSLGSFGNIDYVSRIVVPPQTKGFDGSALEKTNLIEAKQAKGNYFFEYTIQPDDTQPNRHFFTYWSVVPGECLVTFSAQSTEELFQTSEATRKLLKSSAESFKVGEDKKK